MNIHGLGTILPDRTELKLLSAPDMVSALRSEYQWRQTRNRFVRERQSRCQACGWDKRIQVHHVVPWHESEDLRYEFSNLITLCEYCHFKFGHWLNWRDSNPDVRALCIMLQLEWPARVWDRALADSRLLAENTGARGARPVVACHL